MEEVVGVAAPEAGDAEDDVEGDGGGQPAHQRPESRGGDQVARDVDAPAIASAPVVRDLVALADVDVAEHLEHDHHLHERENASCPIFTQK